MFNHQLDSRQKYFFSAVHCQSFSLAYYFINGLKLTQIVHYINLFYFQSLLLQNNLNHLIHLLNFLIFIWDILFLIIIPILLSVTRPNPIYTNVDIKFSKYWCQVAQAKRGFYSLNSIYSPMRRNQVDEPVHFIIKFANLLSNS